MQASGKPSRPEERSMSSAASPAVPTEHAGLFQRLSEQFPLIKPHIIVNVLRQNEYKEKFTRTELQFFLRNNEAQLRAAKEEDRVVVQQLSRHEKVEENQPRPSATNSRRLKNSRRPRRPFAPSPPYVQKTPSRLPAVIAEAPVPPAPTTATVVSQLPPDVQTILPSQPTPLPSAEDTPTPHAVPNQPPVKVFSDMRYKKKVEVKRDWEEEPSQSSLYVRKARVEVVQKKWESDEERLKGEREKVLEQHIRELARTIAEQQSKIAELERRLTAHDAHPTLEPLCLVPWTAVEHLFTACSYK